ncbi:synaptotagmin-6-like isoform X1 [Biomphalaria pfeifferi]|uniref:Synaptotagmin-6-like isoform X1 n=1 Tax=Biomphalaria pfeifferi TaxID=112525 RepID=A0AAD8F602_BIOPF|nr:synaptotagmin-6-like isoform X1 [Biomphalaria pfeifferi]
MVSVVALGVVCGFGVVAALFVGVLAVYLLCRRRGASSGSLPVDRSSYEAVGDYKPPSLLSISSTTSQVSNVEPRDRHVFPR